MAQSGLSQMLTRMSGLEGIADSQEREGCCPHLARSNSSALQHAGGTEARHQRRTGLEARSMAAVFPTEVASIADAQSP